MSLKMKGKLDQTDVRQKIDDLVMKSTAMAIGLIVGICSVNVISIAIIELIADFLVSLTHISFNGMIVSSLVAMMSMVRNLLLTVIVFDLVLKKDVLKMEENIRYVLFLVINYLVYLGCGFFIALCSDQYAFGFLVGSLFNYVGLGAVTRLLSLLLNFAGMLRYVGFITFLGYVLYQCIEIMSIALCAGWILKLLSDEATEHGLTLKEALLRPFTAAKEDELTDSVLEEMSYEESQTEEVKVDTGVLPVSVDLVDMYCTIHHDYFGTDKMPLVRERLLMLSEQKYEDVVAMDYVNPDMIFIVSALSGSFGLDRFLIGDTAMGLLKLLTFGCFGVLTLIDLLTIRKRTQELNFQKIMSI